MEGFGIDKLLLILVIVLVLFGARRVPEIGASIGKGIREFKKGMKDLGDIAEPPSRPNVSAPTTTSSVQPPPDPEKEPKRLLRS
jgi:sec-independent protein translocase protein TatA